MEVSFGKPENSSAAPVIDVGSKTTEAPAQVHNASPAPAAAPVEQPTAPAAPTQAVVPAGTRALGPAGLLLGDKLPSFGDIILPRINIAQNIGGLKDQFAPGSMIFGQNLLLFKPPVADVKDKAGNIVKAGEPASPPVTMIVLGFRPTRFVEKVKGGARGMIVNSEDEVSRNGGTLDYKEWEMKQGAGMKLFQPLADALVVVERPAHCADDGTVFIYEVEGKKYALALWSMKGTIYTEGAKRVLFTARAVGCLQQGGYPSYTFAVSIVEKPYQNGNKSWVPVCIPIAKSSPEQLKFVRGILGAE